MKQFLLKLFKNQWLLFAAILCFALSIRLFHVTAPLQDADSWRQADTASIARNLYRNGMNIFAPEIDWGAPGPYRIESEFPLYSFTVALGYSLAGGVHETIGRILSIIYFLGSLSLFYFLIAKYFGKFHALLSMFIVSFLPFGIYYSRAFQPDSLMIFLVVLTIFLFDLALSRRSNNLLIISSVVGALAILTKLPAIFFFSLPVLYLMLSDLKVKFEKQKIIYYSLWWAIALFFPIMWSIYAHHFSLSFYIWNDSPSEIIHFLSNPAYWNEIIFKLLPLFVFGYLGTIPFLLGLVLKNQTKISSLFYFWVLGCGLFLLVASLKIYHQVYYLYPLIFPAAFFTANCLVYLWTKVKLYGNFLNVKVAKVGVVIFLAFWMFISFVFIKPSFAVDHSVDQYKRVAEIRRGREATLIQMDSNPTIVYALDHKTFIVFGDGIIEQVQQTVKRGSKLIVLLSNFPNKQPIVEVLDNQYNRLYIKSSNLEVWTVNQ